MTLISNVSLPIVLSIIIGLGLITLILLILVIHLEIKVKKLLQGKDGKSLESSILRIKKELEEEQKFKKEMELYLTSVEKRVQKSVRGVATIRFNAFKGTGSGGNQSFATAYLDEKGNGVVVSSLNARERTSVFAKPLKNYISEFELSPEEKEAVTTAKAQL
jgi:hypothetical protein